MDLDRANELLKAMVMLPRAATLLEFAGRAINPAKISWMDPQSCLAVIVHDTRGEDVTVLFSRHEIGEADEGAFVQMAQERIALEVMYRRNLAEFRL